MSESGATIKGDKEVREALRETIEGLPVFFREFGGVAFARLAARSVGTYMRNAAGEPDRRSKTDRGPLRVVDGRLAKAQSGGDTAGSREGIRKIEATKRGARFTFGNRVPYGRIHEKGAKNLSVRVKAHTRKVDRFFGYTLDEPISVDVRAHTRIMNMPARPYNEPALDDEHPWIQRRLEHDFGVYFNRHLGGAAA